MHTGERNRRRKFAQNFLIDKSISQKIVTAARLEPQDSVLEIGPGDGALTRLLGEHAKRIVAVEKDPIQAHKLISSLQVDNIAIIQADIATYDYLGHFAKGEDGISNFVVVSNLPYNAATHILQLILNAAARPKRMIVMTQREVAQRITAKPGDLSILGVATQLLTRAQMLFDVPPEAFVPRPNVFSSVIELLPYKDSELIVPKDDLSGLLRLVRIGFSSKRKKLSNNISSGLGLDKKIVENSLQSNDIDMNIRAEQLSLPQWLSLAKNFKLVS